MKSPPFDPKRLRKLGEEQGQAWGGFLRTHARLMRRLDADLRESHGITLSEFEVLLSLAFAPEQRLRMSDLAEALVVTNSGISRIIDRLVAIDWVRRETSAEDRRVAYAVLTGDGLQLLLDAHATHLEGVRRDFLSHCTTSDLKTLAGLWRRIGEGLGPKPVDTILNPPHASSTRRSRSRRA
jgi:DNA-binding MarR family transcriptional regulator